MGTLEAYAERIDQMRLDGLFGGDNGDDIAAAADKLPEESQHHYLIALSLLDQAKRHIKIAVIRADEEII